MPVSWQMAPSPAAAWSMFCPMIVEGLGRPGAFRLFPVATRIAARTSGGRSVEVLMTRSSTESKKPGSILVV